MLRIRGSGNKSFRCHGVATCAVILLALAAPSAAAERPCQPARPGETFAVDFADVELETIARLVSCAAELAILYSSPTLAGRRVTVLAPRPVELRGLLALFRHALVGAGLVMETRGAYHVIRAAEGGGGGPAHAPSKRRSSSGR